MLSRPCGWRPLWGPRCPHILSSRGPAVTGNPLEGYGLTLEQSLPKEGRSGKHALSWESLAAAHSSENRLPFPQGHGPLPPGEANAPGPLLCPDKAQDRLGLPVASGPDTRRLGRCLPGRIPAGQRLEGPTCPGDTTGTPRGHFQVPPPLGLLRRRGERWEPVWVEREGFACNKHHWAAELRGHHFNKPRVLAVCQAGLHPGHPPPPRD